MAVKDKVSFLTSESGLPFARKLDVGLNLGAFGDLDGFQSSRDLVGGRPLPYQLIQATRYHISTFQRRLSKPIIQSYLDASRIFRHTTKTLHLGHHLWNDGASSLKFCSCTHPARVTKLNRTCPSIVFAER